MCGLGLAGAGSKDKNVSRLMNNSVLGVGYKKVTDKKLSDTIEKQDNKIKSKIF